VNRYIALHPEEFPRGFAPHFTGLDVLAKDVELPSLAQANGCSRAWTQLGAPIRTTDQCLGVRAEAHDVGKAILLRNPHLTGLPATTRRTSSCPAFWTSTAICASAGRSP
jgi:hypothetical protein